MQQQQQQQQLSPRVANPALSVKEWVRLSDEDPVLVSVSEPHKESKGLFKTTVLYLIRTSSKTDTASVHRSYKDFVAFRNALQHRFPGASVPHLPPTQTVNSKSDQFVQRRMHQLEFFMQAVSQNPFFRGDDAYFAFARDNDAFDRALGEPAAASGPGSEGANRWRQALAESQVSNGAQLAVELLRELELVREQLKAFRKAGQLQVDRVAAAEAASLELYQAVANYYVLERDGIRFMSGSAQLTSATSTTPAREASMADVLLDFADKTSQHAAVLRSPLYSARALSAALIDPVRFELGMLDMWKDQLEGIGGKLRVLRKADAAVAALEADLAAARERAARPDAEGSSKLAKQLAALQERAIPEARRAQQEAAAELERHERGLLGMELGRYRAARTLRLSKMLAALSRLHLRGLDELTKVFDGTGSDVRLARDARGQIIVVRSADAQQHTRWDGSGGGGGGGDDDGQFGDDGASDFGASASQLSALPTAMGDASGTGAHTNVHVHQRKPAGKMSSLLRFRSKGGPKPSAAGASADALLAEALGEDLKDRSNQMQQAADMRDGVRLRARADFTASRSDELDLSAGEPLTGKRVDDALWYVTNRSGDAGLVPSRVVDVAGSEVAESGSEGEGGSLDMRPGTRRERRENAARTALAAPPSPRKLPERPRAPPGLSDDGDGGDDGDDDDDEEEERERERAKQREAEKQREREAKAEREAEKQRDREAKEAARELEKQRDREAKEAARKAELDKQREREAKDAAKLRERQEKVERQEKLAEEERVAAEAAAEAAEEQARKSAEKEARRAAKREKEERRRRKAEAKADAKAAAAAAAADASDDDDEDDDEQSSASSPSRSNLMPSHAPKKRGACVTFIEPTAASDEDDELRRAKDESRKRLSLRARAQSPGPGRRGKSKSIASLARGAQASSGASGSQHMNPASSDDNDDDDDAPPPSLAAAVSSFNRGGLRPAPAAHKQTGPGVVAHKQTGPPLSRAAPGSAASPMDELMQRLAIRGKDE